MKKVILLTLMTAVLLLSEGFPTPAADSDNDGLSNDQEAILGTDPSKADTDGDNLLDGEEYFDYFTDPLKTDTDGDGISDKDDRFPRLLTYEDIQGVTTTVDSIVQGEKGLELHQHVEVRVGNVLIVDWVNFLNEDFTLREAKMTITFDFADPAQPDFTGEGYYKFDESSGMMEIVLPSYTGIFKTKIPWPGKAMTISDWVYHLYSKEPKVGQVYEFNVFYHELLRWGEEPFFQATARIIGTEKLPLETKLGRKDYEVYVVEAVLKHPTFKDPFFGAFLGRDPEFTTRAYITVNKGVILRYTTPYFRITPSKAVGFSDFIVVH